jgi:hypothetical protein
MIVLLRKFVATTILAVAAVCVLPAASHADPDANVCQFASCANVNTTCGVNPSSGNQTITLAIALNNLSTGAASAARLTLAEVTGATIHSVTVGSDPDGLDVDLPGHSIAIGAPNRNPPGFYRYGNYVAASAERTDASSPGNYTLVLAFRDGDGNSLSLRSADVTNTADPSPANQIPSFGLDQPFGVAAQQSLFGAPGFDNRGPLRYATTGQVIDVGHPMPDCPNTTPPTGQLTDEQLALGPWSIDGVTPVTIEYTADPGADLSAIVNWELGDVVDNLFAGRPNDSMSFGRFFVANGPNVTLPSWVNSSTSGPTALSGWLPLSDGTCPNAGVASQFGVLQPVTTCEKPPAQADDDADLINRVCANQLAAMGIRPDSAGDDSEGGMASGCRAAGGGSPGAGALIGLVGGAMLLGLRRRRARR